MKNKGVPPSQSGGDDDCEDAGNSVHTEVPGPCSDAAKRTNKQTDGPGGRALAWWRAHNEPKARGGYVS